MDQVYVLKQPIKFIFLMKTRYERQIKLLRNTEALMESPKLMLLKDLKIKIKYCNMSKPI